MKAAIYVRYSSDNQRQESIEAQIRAIEKYCVSSNIEIVKVYADEAKTATNDNRPEFLKMFKVIDMGLFDCIVVHKLDRFARNRYDSAYYKRKLKQNNVRLISVTEQLDESPESVILESMLEGMAEYYSKNLSREVMKGMRETAYQCKHTGGFPPFGYNVNTENKYEINEFEAIAVKKIYEMYLSDVRNHDICNWLHDNGYKTKAGKNFSIGSLKSILENEKYIGIYTFNRKKRVIINGLKKDIENSDDEIIRIENGIPSILEESLFKKVQSKKIEKKIASQSYKAKEKYLLSGYLYCGECGGVMSGSRSLGGRGYKHLYVRYICNTRKKFKTCVKKPLDRDKIEKAVLGHLEEEVFNDKFINDFAKKIYDFYIGSKNEVDSDINEFEKQIKIINAKIENIINAISEGITNSSLKNKLNELEQQKKELNHFIIEEKIKSCPVITKQEIIDILSIGKNITSKPYEDQRKVLNMFIDKIMVHDNKFSIHFKTKNIVEVDTKSGGEGQHLVSTSDY
jgi:site-specific DNA recombinase